MRSSYNNTAVRILPFHGKLYSWSRRKSQVYYIDSHRKQSLNNQFINHWAGDTSITTNYNLGRFFSRREHAGISRTESYNINWRQIFIWMPANSPPNSRYTFYQCQFQRFKNAKNK